MTLIEIARILVDLRKRTLPIVRKSELAQIMDAQDIREAVDRRWLIPHESGELSVTHFEQQVKEFTDMVEAEDDRILAVGDPVVVTNDGVAYTGVLSKKDNSGWQVSFGQKKPTRTRTWQTTEIRRLKPGEKADVTPPRTQPVLT